MRQFYMGGTIDMEDEDDKSCDYCGEELVGGVCPDCGDGDEEESEFDSDDEEGFESEDEDD